MIYHYKEKIDIKNIILKSKLKYGDGYIFYPISMKKEGLVIETPKLYIPYGKKIMEKK